MIAWQNNSMSDLLIELLFSVDWFTESYQTWLIDWF